MAAASSTRVMSEVRASRARVIVVGGIAQALYAACVLMAYNVVGGETARRCEQINCDAGDRFGAERSGCSPCSPSSTWSAPP